MQYIGPETAFGKRTSYTRTRQMSPEEMIKKGLDPSKHPTLGWKYRQQEQERITGEYGAAQTKAREATKARETEVRSIYDEIIGRYGPTGTFGAGFEAQLGRQKTKEVAAGGQALVGAGLYGTTQLAGLGKKFEEEVGMPSRLKLEDVRQERLSQAQLGKAGFVERISDMYPDYALMAQLMKQASSY